MPRAEGEAVCPGPNGLAAARHRPATAKGFVFITMADKDGSMNVIVKPDV
jgi:hypothetical protein